MEDGNQMNKSDVIYEDNHIIVVRKPENILSQKDNTNDIDMTEIVKNYLKDKYNKPGNVYLGLLHRLDRPVGGLMIMAKTSKAAKRLSDDIKKHKLNKTYIAVVDGIIEKDNGVMKDYLKRLPNGNVITTTNTDGKYAELEYKVLEKNKKAKKTLVEINLKTGRHHQIRVQFSSRGHALCGDQRYNKKDKTQIALFANKLSFIHPVKKEKMTFSIKPKNNGYWTLFTL